MPLLFTHSHAGSLGRVSILRYLGRDGVGWGAVCKIKLERRFSQKRLSAHRDEARRFHSHVAPLASLLVREVQVLDVMSRSVRFASWSGSPETLNSSRGWAGAAEIAAPISRSCARQSGLLNPQGLRARRPHPSAGQACAPILRRAGKHDRPRHLQPSGGWW